MRIIYFTKS